MFNLILRDPLVLECRPQILVEERKLRNILRDVWVDVPTGVLVTWDSIRVIVRTDTKRN